MKKTINKLLILEIIRYLLISLYLYTTFHKIKDLTSFEESLLRSSLISDFYLYIKYLLPISELLTVVLLFIDKYFIIGLYLSLFLMITFTLYLVALNNFSIFHGCSCGGVFDNMSFIEHLIINLIIIILNIVGIFFFNKKYYSK